MPYDTYNNSAHLVAQAHGLYIRLRDRLGAEGNSYILIHHAYKRYRRRIDRLGA